MNELAYQNILDLIQQGKVKIEAHRFSPRSFLKSLWLKFACAYLKFRAVRDYEFFQETYRSGLISLRLADGRIVSHPAPPEEVLSRPLH